MFAFKSKTEIVIRIFLTAVIFLNALTINSTPVQAEQETISINAGKLENRSIPTFPTFERPEERITARNEYQIDESVPMSDSAYAPMEQLQMYTATGEEGLRLAQDWVGGGTLAADWIVQKSASSTTTHESLLTFFS